MADDRTESEQEYANTYTEGVRIELPDLSRVALEPGDVLLVRTRQRLDMQSAHAIKDRLGQVLPGHQVLILGDGIELAVIRPLPRDDGDNDPRPQEV